MLLPSAVPSFDWLRKCWMRPGMGCCAFSGEPCRSRYLWSEFEFVWESVPRTRFISILSCALSFGVWKFSSPCIALLLDDCTELGDSGGWRFSLCCLVNWFALDGCSLVRVPVFPVDASIVRLGASFTKFPSRYSLEYK